MIKSMKYGKKWDQDINVIELVTFKSFFSLFAFFGIISLIVSKDLHQLLDVMTFFVVVNIIALFIIKGVMIFIREVFF